MKFKVLCLLGLVSFLFSCVRPRPPVHETSDKTSFDVLIRGGTIYDGNGGAPYVADLAIRDGQIVAIGNLPDAIAESTVRAEGLAVAPGFINVLSWANESLIADGRAASDVRQGVTLEIFGEGWSMGPVNEVIKDDLIRAQADIKYDVTWNTLGGYLDFLEQRGVAVNIASFVGAATVRIHVLGHENRQPTHEELTEMQELVRGAMREGALGVGSSLIYAPASYASTEELTALVAAAAEFDGGYISHLRSEGDAFLEALEELIGIARATGARAEIYHLKAAGKHNWPKMKQAVAAIESARREGLQISANMYPYPAGGTGLDACMDPAVLSGGAEAWFTRLQQPEVRKTVTDAMFKQADGWENMCFAAGPEGMLLFGFKNPALKPLAGKSLAERIDIAIRHQAPRQQVVIEEHRREALDVAQLEIGEPAHRKGDKPFERAQRDPLPFGDERRADRHQQRHREQRDHRLVAGAAFFPGLVEAKMDAQRIIAADPIASDEALRRGFHIMLRLERVGFLARFEMMVLDHKALALEQPFRLDSIGTDMAGHDHAVQDSRLRIAQRFAFSNSVTSSSNFSRCSVSSPDAIASATQQAAWSLRISVSARASAALTAWICVRMSMQ